MERESRGEEQLVSCCGDGDVVDVGEGNGGGFREGTKGEKAERVGRHHGMRICKCVKKNRIIPQAQCIRVTLPYNGETTSHDPESQRAYFHVGIQKSIVRN